MGGGICLLIRTGPCILFPLLWGLFGLLMLGLCAYPMAYCCGCVHTPGLPLAYPLAYPWHTPGTPLAYPWHTPGLPLAYHWPTTGPPTSREFPTPGPHLAHQF